ncbi:ABC-three component system middle component 2 [Faecalimonas sp.]
MEINFSDYINDSVRILILLNATKNRKTIKMTESKIKLYDYFLKFPCTMFGENHTQNIQWNVDEYYAFFHWHPDLIRYRQCLSYLQAKCFIEKTFDKSGPFFTITDLGTNALDTIHNGYKKHLVDLANQLVPTVAKLSDRKIEQMIEEKSRTGMRREEVTV